MTTDVAPDTLPIPASHLDLLTRPICGVPRRRGRRRPSAVERRVVRRRRRQRPGQHAARAPEGSEPGGEPKVSLLVVDPDDTARFIQIRGDAELVTDGALEHLDALTRRYTRHPAYYGYIYPVEQRSRETRVICRIHARRVTLDAIHA